MKAPLPLLIALAVVLALVLPVLSIVAGAVAGYLYFDEPPPKIVVEWVPHDASAGATAAPQSPLPGPRGSDRR